MRTLVLLILCMFAGPQEAVEKTFRFDFSSGEKKTNMEVETTETPFNTQDRKSIVFHRPGTSRLTAKFHLPAKPTDAVLSIEHLSAGAQVKFGGTSQIAVFVNGDPLVRDWEIGAHGYTTDRLTLTKMLREGENAVEIRFTGGQTTYWLKRFEIPCTFPAGTDLEGKVERIEGKGRYAVVVSRATWGRAEWKKVVEALRARYDATIIVYPSSVSQAKEELAGVFPKHACFVARPEEAGRSFVISVHRLTRALDDDPYTDVLWGILTGYEAKDALCIAEHREPLTVRRGAAGCGLDLNAFEEGVWYSESEKNAMWTKKPGGTPEKQKCPDDTTRALVDVLNVFKPDYFGTSGHATQRDWQIGYSYKNGQFRCRDGQLFGLDLRGGRHDVRSPNPKVYAASGNCLMGYIEDRQTMALAWMRSAGVRQMIGYVVSTWFGYGGHGVNDIFINQQGRFTFSESFYVNNQALVHRLESRYPKAARINFEQWNIETDRNLINNLARKHGLKEKDEVGLLWDRDTVAFYGDPAWEARVKKVREPAWKQALTEDGGTFTFRIETLADASWGRPPVALLPYRVKDVRIREGGDLNPVITDNFILLPRSGKFTKGERLKVVFSATPH